MKRTYPIDDRSLGRLAVVRDRDCLATVAPAVELLRQELQVHDQNQVEDGYARQSS